MEQIYSGREEDEAMLDGSVPVGFTIMRDKKYRCFTKESFEYKEKKPTLKVIPTPSP